MIITWTSPCAPSFTYQIDGPDVLYLGVGEKHEDKFSHMKVEATYDDLTSNAFNTQVYTGIPLSKDPICPFTLNLYPSTLMEEKFRSERPLLFSLLTIGLFMIAALTLYIYDFQVEKRKRNLVKTAKKTDAIVSNMLPANVRNLLYRNATDDDGDDDESFSNDDEDKGVRSMFKGGAIAELYPSATIVFADISRFTAWSSTREPTQVFHLLEVRVFCVDCHVLHPDCDQLLTPYLHRLHHNRLYTQAGTRLRIDTMSPKSKLLEVRIIVQMQLFTLLLIFL